MARFGIAHPQLLFGSLAVLLTGLIGLLALDDAPPVEYSQDIPSLLRGAAEGRRAILYGYLAPGTLRWLGKCDLQFSMAGVPGVVAGDLSKPAPPLLEVHYRSCEFPWALCDLPGADFKLRVRGHPFGTGSQLVLEANELSMLCPAKYVPEGSLELCRRAPEELSRRCPVCLHIMPR